MKKLYQKIIVSILSFAIMGTVCAFAPVMAEASETTTPAKMDFDNKTYQAFWDVEPSIVSAKSEGVLVSALNVDSGRCRQTELFGVSSANVPSSLKGYQFSNANDYLVIDLPQKDNYELKTVEVTVSLGASYEQVFDYYYSTNGEEWVKVNNPAYTTAYVATTHVDRYRSYCEIIKVPSTATKFKVERNSNTYTKLSGFGSLPGVIGFEFAYIPKTNNDILTLEAKNNSDIISFLSSGMLPDGENKWTYVATGDTLADGTKEYGLTLAAHSSGTQYSSTLSAIDGYKITSFSAKFDNANNTGRNIAVTLGDRKVVTPAKSGKQDISVTCEDGAEEITFTSPAYAPKGFTDIVITMEKIVVEDDTPVVLDRFDTDDEYQAWWTTAPSFNFITKSEKVTLAATAKRDDQRQVGYFGRVDTAPYAYSFPNADDSITIKLPAKKNYKLSAVALTVGHKASSYQQPFDYKYSKDNGNTWTAVTNTTYTPGLVASTEPSRYYTFCEVVKVPEGATDLKVVRNSNTVTEGAYNPKYPTVMGLEFGYMPVAMADVLTFSATCDGEIISLLASGIFADGSCGFEQNVGENGYDYDGDGTAEYGYSTKKNGTVTINAVEGYKITSITGKFYGGNSAGNKITVTLGESSSTVGGYVSNDGLMVKDFEVNSKVGADSLTITDESSYSYHVLYDIVITMKKVGTVTPDGDTAMSAAIDGTKATATFTNLGAAPYETMVCILAGYNGERFMETKIEAVYKNDIDGTDMVTFDIPEGATRVKAFLWKDLETIAQVFNDIELAVPAAE